MFLPCRYLFVLRKLERQKDVSFRFAFRAAGSGTRVLKTRTRRLSYGMVCSLNLFLPDLRRARGRRGGRGVNGDGTRKENVELVEGRQGGGVV